MYRDLQSLQPVNRTRDISEAINNIERVLRQLEALGENIEGSYFGTMIEDKLPMWKTEKLEEPKENKKDWTVDDLRQFLNSLAQEK